MLLLDVKRNDGVTLVELLLPRLDAVAAKYFKEEVGQLIAGGDVMIVLDMGGVDFVDSSGIGALIWLLKALSGRGGLVLCNVRTGVMNLLKLTRMAKAFVILPTAAAAVGRLAADLAA